MFNLPLTIKQKIIMGFSTIGILLVAGSIFFYNSLNQISQANTNVELLAVPVQKQSNALQIKLLNMMKVGALGFTQTNTSDLLKSEQAYADLNQEFQSAVTVLKGKLVDQPKMLKTLEQAKIHYQAYVSQSEKFYLSKKNVASANERFEANYQTFLTSRDRASNHMLDVELLVLPGEARLLEDIIGNGTRIDDMLFTLQSTMSGLKQVSELSVLAQHKDDVSFLMANINDNYEFMQRLFTDVNDKSLLEAFAIEFATLNNLLVEPAELYQNKQQALDDFTNAILAYNLSVESFNESYHQLTLLLSLAEERFDELQSTTKSKVATGVNLAIYMALIFIVLATFIAVATTRTMLGPLASANKSLALIAQGDLTQRLTITNEDEFGDLLSLIHI